jgi:DNA-binding LacI/PurR family transcriptional regulator
MLSRANELASKLRKDINAEFYSLGEKMPPERELAKQFGLSRGTVRKAINILEAERLVVCQHGRGTFVSNPVCARSKSSQNTLVAMMTYEKDYYFQKILQPSLVHSSRQGYVMTVGMNSNFKLESQLIDSFLSNGIKGVIMAPRVEYGASNYLRLIKEGVAVVLLDSWLPGYDEDFVSVNNHVGTSQAVKHLYELGHRKIAYAGHDGPNDSPARQERLRGYLDTCRDFGLSVPDEWIIEAGNEISVAKITGILNKKNAPTAFVAYNDTWAISAIQAAHACGLEVPTDLSVVGFDDSEDALRYNIPITSINPQHNEIGITVVNMLIEKLENPQKRPTKAIYITPKLVQRQSTAHYKTKGGA